MSETPHFKFDPRPPVCAPLFDPDLELPPEAVMDAARLIGEWAQKEGLTFWQVGPVCDRRFAPEG